MNLRKLALLASLAGISSAHALTYIGETSTGNDANTTTIIDLSGSNDPSVLWGGSFDNDTNTWTWDHEVVLENIVTITGGTLVIPEGSVVRAQPRSGSFNPGALMIARGAKLIAAGNSGNPIIFTTAAVGTPTNESGTRATFGDQTPSFWDADPKNSPKDPTIAGLMGGVLVLGDASTNADRTGQTGFQQFAEEGFLTANTDDRSTIEGIPTASTAAVAGLDRFGGQKDHDNSGIISYVSIRHGGAKLASNAEINGLTLGGVGSGTTINNVEIWGNTDDGVEIFGGTVNLNNIAIIAPQDDGLDLDVGYRGTVQFLFILASGLTDKLGEWDGDYTGETVNGFTAVTGGPVATNGMPYSAYTIANATMIGNQGTPFQSSADNDLSSLHIRDQTNVRLVNTLIVNLNDDVGAGPIEVDNRGGTNGPAVSPRRTTDGFLFGRSYFKGVTLQGKYTTASAWVNNGSANATIVDSLTKPEYANIFDGDLGLANVPTGGVLPANQLLDPRPSIFDDIVAVAEDTAGGFSGNYKSTGYRGAFDPNEANLWTADWTAADAYGLIVK